MKNVIIVIVVLILLLPVIAVLRPKPVTFERAVQAFEAQGMAVEYPEPVTPPELEAVEHMRMYVDGADVDLYRYDDEGKIMKQLEYQRPDSGTAVVEAMGIGASLGAAPSRNVPVSAQRNGMWMIVVKSPDGALRQRVVTVFSGL